MKITSVIETQISDTPHKVDVRKFRIISTYTGSKGSQTGSAIQAIIKSKRY